METCHWPAAATIFSRVILKMPSMFHCIETCISLVDAWFKIISDLWWRWYPDSRTRIRLFSYSYDSETPVHCAGKWWTSWARSGVFLVVSRRRKRTKLLFGPEEYFPEWVQGDIFPCGSIGGRSARSNFCTPFSSAAAQELNLVYWRKEAAGWQWGTSEMLVERL